MSSYSRDRAHIERLRRARIKSGGESLGGLLAILALPIYAMYYFFKFIWWIIKAMFWLVFWPLKLFKK